MALIFPKRVIPLIGMMGSLLSRSFCSRPSMFLHEEIEKSELESPRSGQTKVVAQFSFGVHMNLSPLFPGPNPPKGGYSIEVLDAEAWRMSAGLAEACRGNPGNLDKGNFAESTVDPARDSDHPLLPNDECDPEPDFDEIDSMRIRGNLFYKLDRTSKEFEEYNFDFHRKKSPKRKEDPKEVKNKEKDVNFQNGKKLIAREESPAYLLNDEFKELGYVKEEEPEKNKKKARVPTFNELTGPYHEPFCLDVFISKASVRACIVHRVTSKVVVVAHSISKDMKFDLSSTRNVRACEAVGEVLAQRALADDIHDIVYTPRRGEVLEGKLGVVVRAIVNSGVNVKVKLKKARQKGGGRRSSW